jgi:predicted nucleic acid-binding Zn ribbon protein
VVLTAHTCAACGSRFEAVRIDAETCSGRCRARLSRERRASAEAARAERLAADVERAAALLAADVERAAALLASLRAASALTPPD